MPRGTYLHVEEQVTERFQCAPGAGGWRYVGERADGGRTDLTVDARWRQIRVELATRHWLLRGGVAGSELYWIRSGASGEPAEHAARAAGFLGESPAFLVAVARSLRLAAGGSAAVRLVRVQGPGLAALDIGQRWRLAETTTYAAELAPLPVERYEITDLATAETVEVHLAGDVVLAAPGLELEDLESPPTLP
ncbi:hypothetical protein DPM19_14970 [Actinomadura craniellae]|uniref:Uncharacterized protein n=1 Tax=Actinomadura craniellae TaxID=2231787 RepID=A0A365H5G8_9ACTN|nr:hypothetical protein [Actinomadura craniellae]RAY14278.1 hypothetical protein DPM19_14970 [Actinomadura craniellae]